jgi:superfamily II helicase
VIANKARFKYSRKLEKATGLRVPDFAFNGVFLEILTTAVNFEYLDRGLRQQVMHFIRDFLGCECRESPQCGCPERKFAMHIIELRELGLDHRQISETLVEEYGIDLYPADILSFLEDSVHVLEAISDVARLQGAKDIAEKAAAHIEKIEG